MLCGSVFIPLQCLLTLSHLPSLFSLLACAVTRTEGYFYEFRERPEGNQFGHLSAHKTAQ